jgi:hypothetical protein
MPPAVELTASSTRTLSCKNYSEKHETLGVDLEWFCAVVLRSNQEVNMH